MCTACELKAPVKVEYVNPKLNKTPTMLIGNETLPCFGHLPLEFHQYGIKYSTFHGYRPNNEIKFVNNAKIVSIRLCNGHLRSWPVHPTIDIALIMFILHVILLTF